MCAKTVLLGQTRESGSMVADCYAVLYECIYKIRCSFGSNQFLPNNAPILSITKFKCALVVLRAYNVFDPTPVDATDPLPNWLREVRFCLEWHAFVLWAERFVTSPVMGKFNVQCRTVAHLYIISNSSCQKLGLRLSTVLNISTFFPFDAISIKENIFAHGMFRDTKA